MVAFISAPHESVKWKAYRSLSVVGRQGTASFRLKNTLEFRYLGIIHVATMGLQEIFGRDTEEFQDSLGISGIDYRFTSFYNAF
jgi:hypothetical protein